MRSFFSVFILSILSAALVSCASDQNRIKNQDRPLAQIRSAIIAVMGEPRWTSVDVREFQSAYIEAGNSHRDWIRVRILGDRRPYTIEISAIREKKSGRQYEAAEPDLGLEAQFKKDLRERLSKGQGDPNVVDDFRAF